jgi:integrase
MTTRRPRPLKLDSTTARAVRGPHKDGSGRWYWRADLYVARDLPRENLWNGWATREEVRREVSSLLAQRSPVQAAAEEKAAKRSEVGAVKDLLEVYLGSEQTRVEVWRKEETEGEEAIRRGATETVEHGRDALNPRTFSGKKGRAKQVVRKLGHLRLRDLTSDDVRRYVSARGKEAAGGTIKNEIKVLKSAWRWGREERRGYTDGLDVNWPNVVATPVREKVTPTRAEVRKVLAAMEPGWARDILTCQSILGCRIRALARLPAREVDLGRGKVRLKCKKHDRTVRVPDRVLEILRPYVEGNDAAGTLWPVTESTAVSVGDEDPPRLDKKTGELKPRANPLPDACRAAGVTRFTTHGLRRLVSNEWIAANVNVAVYARVLGHSPEEALRSYAAIQGDDEVEAFAIAAKLQDSTNVVTIVRR